MDSSLMDRAKAQNASGEDGGGESFKKPDITQFVPPNLKDVVDRVVAAGVKVMYSPQMKEQVQQAIESQQPVPQKLAENVTGLLLTLDKQTPSGIPQEAIFPVGVELMGEAAEVLQTAGQDVTQGDFNDAMQMMYVLVGKKLGATDEQLMQGASQALPGDDSEEQQEGAQPGAPEEVPEESAGAVPGAQMPPQQPVA